MAEKKKTTKAKSTKAKSIKNKDTLVKKTTRQAAQKIEKKEAIYSFEELADMFGISKIKARSYFNMCQLDYSEKITMKQARELFKKF